MFCYGIFRIADLVNSCVFIYKQRSITRRELLFLIMCVFFLLMWIFYPMFLHYSRKNMLENLNEEEEKSFKVSINGTCAINGIILCFFVGLGISYLIRNKSIQNKEFLKQKFVNLKKYRNTHRNSQIVKDFFRKFSDNTILLILFIILILSGFIMSFVVCERENKEIKVDNYISQEIARNYLNRGGNNWVQVSNDECTINPWTPIWFSPYYNPETYGIANRLSISSLYNLASIVSEMGGYMAVEKCRLYTPSSAEKFYRFHFKKHKLPNDMTPIWNALDDVVKDWKVDNPDSVFGIIQSEKEQYNGKYIDFEFAEFKNADYSKKGVNTNNVKVWMPLDQARKELKKLNELGFKNFKERCNK